MYGADAGTCCTGAALFGGGAFLAARVCAVNPAAFMDAAPPAAYSIILQKLEGCRHSSTACRHLRRSNWPQCSCQDQCVMQFLDRFARVRDKRAYLQLRPCECGKGAGGTDARTSPDLCKPRPPGVHGQLPAEPEAGALHLSQSLRSTADLPHQRPHGASCMIAATCCQSACTSTHHHAGNSAAPVFAPGNFT